MNRIKKHLAQQEGMDTRTDGHNVIREGASVDIAKKGNMSLIGQDVRMKFEVIFYADPEQCALKDEKIPDQESVLALRNTINDILKAHGAHFIGGEAMNREHNRMHMLMEILHSRMQAEKEAQSFGDGAQKDEA